MYKQSPYMLVRLGGGGQRTKVDVKGGQNPIWDEDLQFEIYSQDHDEPRVLRLSCFVEGRKRIDEGIGEGELQIDDVLRRGEFDGTCPPPVIPINRRDKASLRMDTAVAE